MHGVRTSVTSVITRFGVELQPRAAPLEDRIP